MTGEWSGENIFNVMKLIKKVSLKFKKIKWEYKNAIDAANLTQTKNIIYLNLMFF